jgi:hypothetical protein|tara:strand:- start:1070 stop:1243 length:174 start_codon:yes stop_codon:yes gene_type:complete
MMITNPDELASLLNSLIQVRANEKIRIRFAFAAVSKILDRPGMAALAKIETHKHLKS